MVDAYQRANRPGETFNEPTSNRRARPIFAGAGRRRHFARLGRAIPHRDTQALEAGLTRLRPGVVDSDVSLENRAHVSFRNSCKDYQTNAYCAQTRSMGQASIAHKYGIM